MPCLSADALLLDPEGAAFLRDVLGTSPAVPAASAAPKPAAAAAAPASTAAPAESAQRLPRVRKAEAAPMEGASCSSARQKLWVEGEGWVVRRVNRCW